MPNSFFLLPVIHFAFLVFADPSGGSVKIALDISLLLKFVLEHKNVKDNDNGRNDRKALHLEALHDEDSNKHNKRKMIYGSGGYNTPEIRSSILFNELAREVRAD